LLRRLYYIKLAYGGVGGCVESFKSPSVEEELTTSQGSVRKSLGAMKVVSPIAAAVSGKGVLLIGKLQKYVNISLFSY
jgi:hypothetical protein